MLKLAVSADGKVGLPGPKRVAITGPAANARVHRLRSIYDAILIGIGTALADDPLLTCRLPGMEPRSPVRVVLDAMLRLPLAARLVTGALATPVWVFAAEAAPQDAEAALRGHGVEVLRVAGGASTLDLPTVLHALASRGITRLMVEGGPRVARAFLEADLIDEVQLFQAPLVIGSEGIDALAGLPLETITQGRHLRAVGAEPLGVDTLRSFERT
jgi:diaminohydroxyphosphoribosylaminopyrimidine deaminase/5-amino-6-(5-phosphoribosylamino)uracil reductase